MRGETTPQPPQPVTDPESMPNDVCPICISEYEAPLRLHCSHVVCKACLEQMQSKAAHNVCPLCRRQLHLTPDVLCDDGYMYFVRAQRGLDAEANYHRAAAKWEEAAAQGDVTAQFNLGICYKKGKGVARDMRRAVELYEAAVAQGNSRAQYNLGNCYAEGIGVERDLRRAVELWEASEAQGESNVVDLARKPLAYLAERGYCPGRCATCGAVATYC